MDEKTGKNVLIIGNSATEYSLAKKLSELDSVEKVFVASGNDAMKEFSTVIDIREDSIQELLEFALENAVDLTIVSSEKAIKSDIASSFQQSGQTIFAPSASSACICSVKSHGKRFMYKNHIPTPRFGIFDKPSLALEHIKKTKMPIVIKPEEHQKESVLICPTHTIAQRHIEMLFENGEKRVVIEDYVMGHEFSFYVVTDGYKAIPIGIVATYKQEADTDGGTITAGVGAYAPDYKISSQLEQRIMQKIVYPTINSLERNRTPYVGILGLDFVLDSDERLYLLEYNSFLQSPDSEVVLGLLDENLYQLFESCAIGAFADDYENVEISDKYAASCVLSARKADVVIEGIDDLDESTLVAHFGTKKNRYLELETPQGRALILTKCAKTLSRAVENLYDEISLIKFDGMKYRKDIGASGRL